MAHSIRQVCKRSTHLMHLTRSETIHHVAHAYQRPFIITQSSAVIGNAQVHRGLLGPHYWRAAKRSPATPIDATPTRDAESAAGDGEASVVAAGASTGTPLQVMPSEVTEIGPSQLIGPEPLISEISLWPCTARGGGHTVRHSRDSQGTMSCYHPCKVNE
jgi:hypothetical protein